MRTVQAEDEAVRPSAQCAAQRAAQHASHPSVAPSMGPPTSAEAVHRSSSSLAHQDSHITGPVPAASTPLDLMQVRHQACCLLFCLRVVSCLAA